MRRIDRRNRAPQARPHESSLNLAGLRDIVERPQRHGARQACPGGPRVLLTRTGRRRTIAEPPVGHFDIVHDGVSHRITLKRVATARQYTLRVRMARGDVVLTMPPHGSTHAAREFAARHAGWVAVRVARLQRPVAFEPGAVVPLRGVPHRLVARSGLRRRVWLEDGAEPGTLCVNAPAQDFATAVLCFLKGEARQALAEATTRHAARIGRRPAGLTLRDTKSRWGSCTARGHLNFSWRLILAPPPVLDYVAAHEVAHLTHMNHSAAFWTLTRRLAPQLDEAEAWLKANGAKLHRYGASTPMPLGPCG